MEGEDREVAVPRDDRGLHIARGAEVEHHAAGDQFVTQCRVINGNGAMRDARGRDLQRTPNLRRATPLARVQRDCKTAAPRDIKRILECKRVREGSLATSKVESNHTKIFRCNGGDRKCTVLVHAVRAQRSDDQSNLNTDFRRSRICTARNSGDHL